MDPLLSFIIAKQNFHSLLRLPTSPKGALYHFLCCIRGNKLPIDRVYGQAHNRHLLPIVVGGCVIFIPRQRLLENSRNAMKVGHYNVAILAHVKKATNTILTLRCDANCFRFVVSKGICGSKPTSASLLRWSRKG